MTTQHVNGKTMNLGKPARHRIKGIIAEQQQPFPEECGDGIAAAAKKRTIEELNGKTP